MSATVHNATTALALVVIRTLLVGCPVAVVISTACNPDRDRSDFSDLDCEEILSATPVTEIWPINPGMGMSWVACVPPAFVSDEERSCDDVRFFLIQPHQLSAYVGYRCWKAGDYYPDGDDCLDPVEHTSISGWVWCDPQ